MKYWKLPKVFVLVLTLALLIILFIVIKSTTEEIRLTQSSVIELNDCWTLEREGQKTANIDISAEDIGVIKDKEVVRLSHILKDIGLDNPCLSFYSTHVLVNVYFDGQLYYSYGGDYQSNDNSIPKKHHYLPLGNDYDGKLLTLEFIGGHNTTFSGLSYVYLGTRAGILTAQLSDSWLAILTGLFLFTLAILLIILSPYLFLYHNNDLRIFFSGLISLMLAIYILAFYGIFDIFINNSLLNTVLEYAALYNIPTTVMGYLMSGFTGKTRKIFFGIFLFDICLFLSSIILHFSHIARFSDFTFVIHIAAGAEGIFAVYIIIKNYIDNKKELSQHSIASDNIFIAGLIIFILLSTIDIIRYNLLRYVSDIAHSRTSLMGSTIGSLIFVTFLLLSYFFYNISSTNIDSLQSRIMNLAYTDALTGLSNRARCEQMLEMLTEEHGTYAIVSLDLNYLKKVNDSLGHHEGDRLLTGFATILTDCFWDANLVGRMGGDEFIVILMEDRIVNLTKRIHDLYNMINEWNIKEQRFKYSAAYGYAYSSEVPNGSAKEVYMLADGRMYEMKREQHEHEEKEVFANA